MMFLCFGVFVLLPLGTFALAVVADMDSRDLERERIRSKRCPKCDSRKVSE